MVYRITGGITFLLLGLQAFGVGVIPGVIVGIFALVTGVSLLAGV